MKGLCTGSIGSGLLKKRLGIIPELHPFPIGSDLQELETDAVLIIGDRARLTNLNLQKPGI